MVHVAHCSKTSGLRSACEYRSQLAHATGKCVMERLISYVKMRDQTPPVYSQREGQQVFHQVSW